ncbi:MAG: H/ACA RNA-protein complex protein Gar1 [Thermoprotei archaeon]|mgnify:CR=1 FL=1|nr:MAG: H/ACA RNA-protein complex protein Gar1 [Thermoprotei archaeon]
MRYLGLPLHTTKTGYLIVQLRSREIPPLESLVLTKYMKIIGKIIDIIGSVKEPYAVVKLSKGLTVHRIPSPLYYRPRRPRRKTRKRR